MPWQVGRIAPGFKIVKADKGGGIANSITFDNWPQLQDLFITVDSQTNQPFPSFGFYCHDLAGKADKAALVIFSRPQAGFAVVSPLAN